jgi:hypothetical protein
MLQRAVLHSHAVAIRSALGASTFRRALPLLGESLLIVTFGLSLAFGLSKVVLLWANRTLMRPEWFPFVPPLKIKLGDFCLGALLGFGIVLIATTLSLLRTRCGDSEELVSGGRGGPSVSTGRISRLLVIVQTALGTTLLIVALLFVASEYHTANGNLGIAKRDILSVSIGPPQSMYAHRDALSQTLREVEEHIRQIHGVVSVGVVNQFPIGSFKIGVHLRNQLEESRLINYQVIQGSALQTLSIPVVKGRTYRGEGGSAGRSITFVNTAFVTDYVRKRDALGRQVYLHVPTAHANYEALTIIGVTGSVKTFGLTALAPPAVYVPLNEVPKSLFGSVIKRLYLFVRVAGRPTSYERSIKAVLQKYAPGFSIGDVSPVSRRLRNFFAPARLIAEIISALALTALVLAALGLYAVTSVNVLSRQMEWAVRASVGSSPARLVVSALRESSLLIFLGMLIGIALGLLACNVVRSLLVFSVTGVYGGAAFAVLAGTLILSGVAVVSSLIPALRTARLSSVSVLLGSAN